MIRIVGHYNGRPDEVALLDRRSVVIKVRVAAGDGFDRPTWLTLWHLDRPPRRCTPSFRPDIDLIAL